MEFKNPGSVFSLFKLIDPNSGAAKTLPVNAQFNLNGCRRPYPDIRLSCGIADTQVVSTIIGIMRKINAIKFPISHLFRISFLKAFFFPSGEMPRLCSTISRGLIIPFILFIYNSCAPLEPLAMEISSFLVFRLPDFSGVLPCSISIFGLPHR